MLQQDSYEMVFERLKSVLEPYAASLHVREESPDDYYLKVPHSPRSQREVNFGAVKVKKSYVSYHLFPLYAYPELLEDVDPDLKARMQGKTCFNFKRMTEAQLQELTRLTRSCYERVRQESQA